jgi:hypothetical protein
MQIKSKFLDVEPIFSLEPIVSYSRGVLFPYCLLFRVCPSNCLICRAKYAPLLCTQTSKLHPFYPALEQMIMSTFLREYVAHFALAFFQYTEQNLIIKRFPRIDNLLDVVSKDINLLAPEH